MHDEAREVLPELLGDLAAERPVLLGHSDGASIALIHAAEHPVAGVAAIAPHVFVEELCVAAIKETLDAFERGELRERMRRHHHSPDAAFWGWAGVWLDPAFRGWNLTPLLDGISAPLLLIQGSEDEYGTLAQLDAVDRFVSRARIDRLVLPGGHAPHLEHPDRVLTAVAEFIGRLPAPEA